MIYSGACKHDEAPSPDCEYCRCQSRSKHGAHQCQDDPNHEGAHWCLGGTAPDFDGIMWPRCPRVCMPSSGRIRLLTRCDQKPGHEGDCTGISMSALDFEENPVNPRRGPIQLVTMRPVQWRMCHEASR